MSPSPLRGYRIVVEERTLLIRDVVATSREAAQAIAEFLIREGCQGFEAHSPNRELIRVRKLKGEVSQ